MIVYQHIRIQYAVMRRKTSEQRTGIPVLESFYAGRHSSKFSSVNLNAVMFGAATALVLGLVG